MANGIEWKEFKWAENGALHARGTIIEGIRNFKYFPIQTI